MQDPHHGALFGCSDGQVVFVLDTDLPGHIGALVVGPWREPVVGRGAPLLLIGLTINGQEIVGIVPEPVALGRIPPVGSRFPCILQCHHMVDLHSGTGSFPPDEGDGPARIWIVQDAGGDLAATQGGGAHLSQVPGQDILSDVAAVTVHVGFLEPEGVPAILPPRPGAVFHLKVLQGLCGIAPCLVAARQTPYRPVDPGEDQTDGDTDDQGEDQQDQDAFQGRGGPESGTRPGPYRTALPSFGSAGHPSCCLPAIAWVTPSGVGIGSRIVARTDRTVQSIDGGVFRLGQ